MTTENTCVGLDVCALSVAYGTHTVLKDVDLTIPPGASLAIVGESGCGKTTLLTTVAGLMPVAGGSVRWQDSSGNDRTKIRSSFV